MVGAQRVLGAGVTREERPKKQTKQQQKPTNQKKKERKETNQQKRKSKIITKKPAAPKEPEVKNKH